MKIHTYETVPTATDEEFKALTSLTKAEFEELLTSFSTVLRKSRSTAAGRPANLPSCGDKLLIIHCYLKNYPLQEVLGLFFGLEQSQANRWNKTHSAVLRETLKPGGYLPAREAQPLTETLANSSSLDLIVDGTERRRQRPKEQDAQKTYYSGKKR